MILKNFPALVYRETLLCWRNKLILVTAITLAAMVAVYYALPLFSALSGKEGETTVLLDRTEDGLFTSYLLSAGGGHFLLAETEEEFSAMISEGSNRTGVEISGNRTGMTFSSTFQYPPSPLYKALAEGFFRSLAAEALAWQERLPTRVERLRPESIMVSSRDRMIAILLAFEVMILGFLFVSVLVFSEKSEGIMRSIRISPSGVFPYVLSKTVVFTILSTVYGLLLVLFTIGTASNFIALTVLLLLSCGFMTLLGLGIASFFRSISDWFVPGVIALSINMMALIPYQLSGSFSPLFSILPGYTVIFGIHEILFHSGNAPLFMKTTAILLAEFAVCLLFAWWSVKRNSVKEK